MKTLAEIQQKLRSPKSQLNAFGKYKYRSCEDILESVKPLLGEWSLVVGDEIVLIGERYYIKAKATIERFDVENGDFLRHEAIAFAREPLSKKGMDESQITGAASSYARKYALNGLFAIDDTKDADTSDNRSPEAQKPAFKPKAVTTTIMLIQNELSRLTDAFKDSGSLVDIYKTLGVAGFNEIKELDEDSKTDVLNTLKECK